MGLGENLLYCSAKETAIKWLLIAYCYTHWSEHCLPSSEEAASCSRWELTQGLTTGHCIKSERLWSTQPSPPPKCGIFVNTSPQGSRIYAVMCDSKDMTFSVCFSDTTELMHVWTHRDCEDTHRTFTGSKQIKVPEKGKGTQNLIPNPETICNWYLLINGKSIFSNCHWHWQPHSREGSMPKDSRSTQNSSIFVCLLFGVCLILRCCFLFVWFVWLFNILGFEGGILNMKLAG